MDERVGIKGWEVNEQVSMRAACTCCGVEVKDGIINVKNHNLFPLPWRVQDLHFGVLYALSEPFLQQRFAVGCRLPELHND